MPTSDVEPYIRRALLAWYRRSARDLPWRRTRDPYHVWLSEVLLQQTRVLTALPYYRRFVAEFPTLAALAAAPLDAVLRLWQGLGYYARARHLYAAARIIVHDRRGHWPRTAAEWQELPGIGRYTASAIASITRDEPVPVVDGNVRRVLARLFAVRGCVDRSATQARLWWLADQLLARNDPGTFNQALMELGARICTPRGPRCDLCPLARWCRAAQVGLQLRLPARRRKPGTPQIEIVAAAVRDGECLLLVRRPPTGLLANLWTLPGGEVTDGRRPADILRSRICSLAHARVRVGQLIAGTQHVFSHRRWRVRIYECRLVAHSRRIRKSAVVRWVRRADLVNYPLASVDRKMLALAW